MIYKATAITEGMIICTREEHEFAKKNLFTLFSPSAKGETYWLH